MTGSGIRTLSVGSKRNNEQMVQVVWSESALSSLAKIAKYIAFDKISAAKRMV